MEFLIIVYRGFSNIIVWSIKNDKNWISIHSRKSTKYVNGAKNFLKFAVKHAPSNSNGLILCPSKKCVNSKNLSVANVRAHLFFNRMNPNYKECEFICC